MTKSVRRFWIRGAVSLAAFFLGATHLNALDARHSQTLRKLGDALIATQIVDPASTNYGALVCPSLNPQTHPLHSRAGEAVYPLAIISKNTDDIRYRDAALLLARWLISIQQPSGAWGENSPHHDGWTGTTADQLLSLAGAFPLLQNDFTPADQTLWQHSIRQAAAYVVKTFPVSNINYQPTGAVALLLASRVVDDPSPEWTIKAASLVATTLASINADGLLTGEGLGVDAGYNLAQSIGYLALYGILKSDASVVDRAAGLLRAHLPFVYPNGSIDNSWGTRSYKWTYESGTKTAPGVYFTFSLLNDQDARFGPAGRLALDYLTTHAMRDGLVNGGPHALQHESLSPPCLYATFTRAQSLALAIAYARPDAINAAPAPLPAQPPRWIRFYPTVKTAVVRTKKMMATVSAYGGIERYGREQVCRGGSVTNLWLDGFGREGFAQTSSVTKYRREEKIHMPDEGTLLPLTPRIECTLGSTYFTNLFEADATMSVQENADHLTVVTSGELRDAKGKSADIHYTITHHFFDGHLTKEFTLSSPHAQVVRIVEPVVKGPGLVVTQRSSQRVDLQPSDCAAWTLSLGKTAANHAFTCGENSEKYWSPFPGVNGYPIAIEITLAANQSTSLQLALAPATQPHSVPAHF